MRCTRCELPLSPTHTPASCPRCGTLLSTGQRSQTLLEVNASADGGPAPIADPAFNGLRGDVPFHAPLSSESQSPAQSERPWMPGSRPVGMDSSGPQYGPSGFQQVPMPPRRPHPRKTINPKVGFMVAGLCILLGGLILVFVYLMATSQTGQPNRPGNSTANNDTPHTTTTRSTPQAIATPTPAPSPTTTVLPGQHYVDNAQLASAIDAKSYKPTQLATTFKVGQTIYVTFDLHPSGQTGVVCVNWYLNGQQVTQYNLTDRGGTFSSFSSAIYGSSGPAYVQIYWTSSPECIGGLLAQHSDFTVTS